MCIVRGADARQPARLTIMMANPKDRTEEFNKIVERLKKSQVCFSS